MTPACPSVSGSSCRDNQPGETSRARQSCARLAGVKFESRTRISQYRGTPTDLRYIEWSGDINQEPIDSPMTTNPAPDDDHV